MKKLNIFVITPPTVGERSIVISMQCVSVCLSVRKHISKTTRPNFAEFSRCLCGRGSVLLWHRCTTLCTFVNDDSFFSIMGAMVQAEASSQ